MSSATIDYKRNAGEKAVSFSALHPLARCVDPCELRGTQNKIMNHVNHERYKAQDQNRRREHVSVLANSHYFRFNILGHVRFLRPD